MANLGEIRLFNCPLVSAGNFSHARLATSKNFLPFLFNWFVSFFPFSLSLFFFFFKSAMLIGSSFDSGLVSREFIPIRSAYMESLAYQFCYNSCVRYLEFSLAHVCACCSWSKVVSKLNRNASEYFDT